jgi:hypothetical protein
LGREETKCQGRNGAEMNSPLELLQQTASFTSFHFHRTGNEAQTGTQHEATAIAGKQ